MRTTPLLLLLIVACGDDDASPDASSADSSTDSTSMDASTDAETLVVGPDPASLVADGLVRDVSIEECTLSEGTVTQCYRITVTSRPSEHAIGPFCPRNISDGADVSGVWFEDGVLYDADGAFIENLATFYSDPAWQLYDETTGDINVTDTQVACEAAARPDVAAEYQNHCVECDPDYYPDTTSTYVIPVTPVATASPVELGRSAVGLALNGVNFDPPAPTEAILGAYTIAALDDCGGHVNPATGYHYHAATGCSFSVEQSDAHAPLLGYALDGHGIYAMTGDDGIEPTDLDECRGHSDEIRGYHYHVASPGENLFIGCFHGEHGCHVEGDSDEPCDATIADGPPGPPPGG